MDEYPKKHKKKHKKEKKKKRRSKSSSSSSEAEWVEKEIVNNPAKETDKREGWMSLEMDFSSYSSKKKEKPKKEEDNENEKSKELLPGQSSRELNPYWRDGGTGLPPIEKINSYEHRSKEREEFIKESLDERKKYSKYDDLRQTKTGSSSRNEKSWREIHSKMDRSNSSSSKKFMKPESDDPFDKVKYSLDKKKYNTSSSLKKGWKKKDLERDVLQEERSSKSHSCEIESIEEDNLNHGIQLIENDFQKPLSKDEMNNIAAKMIRAEIMGDLKLAEKYKKQLENVRKVDNVTKTEVKESEEREVIILTETDEKGFTRPIKQIREERSHSKRKVETHEGNKRVRYFADDDSQSLQEMFEKERFGSSRDQNATFMKLMATEISSNNEDSFEETASASSTSCHDRKDWNYAIKEHTNRVKALDNCYWCLDSKNMNHDVIVAIRNQVQLCVPSTQSITDNHCIIVPNDHISCSTNLDEDVWEDLMDLRKKLVQVFEAEGDDVIFFECASNLDKFPHMQLHCVPVPKDIGDVAPIYFKKAILECEMEWSNNKKVIELKGRNVRKAVPKGLPYFAVDFGMQPGYAHVIEDKRLFPNNFAQAIIGGMLDLDHSKWRKMHKDTKENIQKKADDLKKFIKKYL